MRAWVRNVLVVAALAVFAVAVPDRGEAAQVLPVRGGAIEVPDFDPSLYHNSEACQLALNAAIGSLTDQLARIPFPPPGEPGYHEWANAIGDQIALLQQQRPPCLRLGPPGRSAPPAKARAFAAKAIPLATRVAALGTAVPGARGKPARRASLGARALRIVDAAAISFDLEALRNPVTWSRSQRLGVDLRKGQIKQLPAFATNLQNVADYDAEIVGITENKAATDPELAARMDHLAALNNEGRPYAQLTLDERREIAKMVAPQSGALQDLLNRVRQLGKSAAKLIFGG